MKYNYIYYSNNLNKINMKKLKRNELKKIDGGIEPFPIACGEDWSCPQGLCCTSGLVCRDWKKYPCI
ncbi:hypothetical protein BOQ62_21145 [Chryseobacterium sp. CH21]|nr:hypothetical protein BOQ62_21145 [Chryseobacterium sp. CH21]